MANANSVFLVLAALVTGAQHDINGHRLVGAALVVAGAVLIRTH